MHKYTSSISGTGHGFIMGLDMIHEYMLDMVNCSKQPSVGSIY